MNKLLQKIFTRRPGYLAQNERARCICGAVRSKVPKNVWRVTNKTTDLIYPEFMYRCPKCSTFSAVNLYFPVEKYEEHNLDHMFISDTKRRLNEARLDWVVKTTSLPENAVLYDLGAGEGCFSHIFANRFASGCVYAVEGDAKVQAKFYGSLQNVKFVNEYIEPFLRRAVRSDSGVQQANLMVLTDVLEHVLAPEEILKLMHDALAPGGVIYITVPDATTFSNPEPEHVPRGALDWMRANRTCQHIWMMPPTVVVDLVGRYFDVLKVSEFEKEIRRDSSYTTIVAIRN